MTEKISIKWLGTAAFILDMDGIKLLFDPFFYRNEESSPKLKTQREDIKDLRGIFITHGHFDHCTDAWWFTETLNTRVYCSDVAKENMINMAEGKSIEKNPIPLSERAREKIHTINYNDMIDITKDIRVEVIKSRHIRFDQNTIQSRLSDRNFRKKIKEMEPYVTDFQKGKVFGFCTYYNDKRIVSFGSLWHKNKTVLEKYQNCDIFLPPLAGASPEHIAEYGGAMVDILKPKVVIPIHWDDFFPPVSRMEDLTLFNKYMAENHPNTKLIMPKIDEEMVINLD